MGERGNWSGRPVAGFPAAALLALSLLIAVLVLAGPAEAGHAELESEAQSMTADEATYELAGACTTMQPQSTTLAVKATRAGRYDAAAILPEQAEAFRMQATGLGSYLMMGADGDFLSTSKSGVVAAGEPTAAGDWKVDFIGDSFTVTSRQTGQALGLDNDGELILVPPARAESFSFAAAGGCIQFPEAELNLVGKPQRGPTPYGEVTGMIDAHAHMMAFESFGGNLHCGRPWSPMGITVALTDCPDHQPNGSAALVENVASYGDPTRMHDPVGWPTFVDWPDNESYTHENVYYRWLERTYRSGMRIMVNLAVDNSALCFVNPFRKFPCNEMLAVRRQIHDTYELQDYVDAQYGGPGEGWFRIVRTPFEAREVINEGKLAVVLGIEVSEIFDCGLREDTPQCTTEEIDAGLDEFQGMGVTQLELVNKFDNALAGVAFDGGVTGAIVNVGNRQATGRFWSAQTCTSEPYDNQPLAIQPGSATEAIVRALIPQGVLPVYPDAPVCNPKGLSDLGRHMLDGMIDRGMLFDPDHMSVLARDQALDLMESREYRGVISSHTWSDDPSYRRIYRMGGFVAPMKSVSTRFVDIWKNRKMLYRQSKAPQQKYPFALGFAEDMNGFSGQPGPREDAGENPLVYPFESPLDPGITVDRQVSGERVFDLNEDGVDHYGLYADWVEDVRIVGGDKIIDDLAAGSEAYLQTWERAVGIPGPGCVQRRAAVTAAGLKKIGMKLNPMKLLRRAGQPDSRPERSYRYCVAGKGNDGAHLAAVFTPGKKARVGLIATDATTHRIGSVRPGVDASRLSGRAKPLGGSYLIEKSGSRARRFVYGVEAGQVSFVAVASRAVTKSPKSLSSYLKLGGL